MSNNNIIDLQRAKDEMDKLRQMIEKAESAQLANMVAFPKTYGKYDTPRNCIENTQALVDHYGVEIKYNEMKRDIEIEIPGVNFCHDTKLNNQLTWIDSKAKEHDLNGPIDVISRHVAYIANQNTYHPVKEWILSEPWDGVSRLDDLYNTIHDDDPVKTIIMRRWLISAVQALFSVHPRYEGVLVFVGKQGKGKTSWLNTLVPDPEWIKEGASLDAQNKDSILEVTSHWLTELGEIGTTFDKRGMASLKAFITRGKDKIRPAFERKANDYVRRTVFFGTVDNYQYLVDEAGNRRWWTVDVGNVNLDHKINIQQLWAEVYEIYKTGEQHWLNPEERAMLDERNKEFTTVNPLEEKLEDAFENPNDPNNPLPSASKNVVAMNVTAMLDHIGYEKPDKKMTNFVGEWLRNNNFVQKDKGKRTWSVIVLTPHKNDKTRLW